MAGGLIQLVASGAEDLYLTGNPQITFFNVVYRRYTNFSTEYMQLPFNKTQSLGTRHSTKMSCKIDRNADLLYDMYLAFDLPAIFTNGDIPFGWVEDVGTKLIYTASLIVGGQEVDRQYGQWLKLQSHIFESESKRKVYERLVGGQNYLQNSGKAIGKSETLAIRAKRLYIPLNFFFCKNPGLSIPLVALQYMEVRVDIEFNALNDVYRIGNPLISPKKMFGSYNLSKGNQAIKDKLYKINPELNQYNLLELFTKDWKSNTFLIANYVYLGTDEQRKFAQTSHEYLIEQVQRKTFQGLMPGKRILELKLLHPVEEIFWVLQNPDVDLTNDWYNFTRLEDPKSLEYYHKSLELSRIPILWPEYKNYLNGEKNQDVMSEFISDIRFKYLDVNTNYENAQYMFGDYFSIMKSAKIMLNNHDRFSEEAYGFFEDLHLYKYHSGRGLPGLYMYSFALKPEEFQPSGTCNMSRITSQQLVLDIYGENTSPTHKYNLYLYATNYNVFRIMAGMGQLVFAN